MEAEVACCLSDNNISDDEDLGALGITEGINVWGANQKVLEDQALKELEIFAKSHKNQDTVLEEGEIEETDETEIENKSTDVTLDIETYINNQVELKKRQDFHKSLACSSHSIELANKLSHKVSRKTKKGRKNSLRENINHTVEDINLDKKQNCDNLEVTQDYEPLNTGHSDEDTKLGSDYVPSDGETDSDYEPGSKTTPNNLSEKIKNISHKRKRRKSKSEHPETVKDDGLWDCYKTRLENYYKKLEEEHVLKRASNDDDEEEDEEEKLEHHLLKGGLKVPLNVWNRLYGYQQDSIKWLWKLHQESTGGILGDEMGLGKTVQIIAFLHSLEYSRIISCHGRFNGLGPSLVVCPATVIHQWVNHFHEWSPEIRVAVLHQSGSYQGNKTNLIKDMHKSKGIIVTTYHGILKYKGNLLDYNWHYVILDEGHKIRNPTAKATVAVKQIRTPHRIMLTGSPMQNNLTELWSLFDFTNSGMLGNLTIFQEHFANPILHGGFTNSTPMQEATALSVATTLKTLISPFLLRRTKHEVQHHISLPNKSEQVLFCSLTNEQKDLYKGYLMSEQVNSILGRGVKNWFSENHMRANVLVAITTLRKICNHPDIYVGDANNENKDDETIAEQEKFGYYKKSGKMIVVSALLKIWKKQGHRVLLFTQGRAMINIFQHFLQQHEYKYLKMDGSTSINSRQSIINKFNQDSSFDVFLLTTRVGGLGVNLTGANRVIIYDPDWNPATDIQARERAWRIGQDKQVTIYRLLSAGTIEEKMYQRQVWKQLLSNKILLDPKTNRFFKSSDLNDLFSLQESPETNSETANMFHNSRVRIEDNLKNKANDKKKYKSKHKKLESSSDIHFTEDKIQAMKNLAQQISKSMSKTPEAPKTTYQQEMEEERERKLKEKAQLKKLTPQELLHYNKEKANQTENDSINRIDDSEAKVGFSEALEYSEKTARLHYVLNSGKIKDPKVVINEVYNHRKKITKETTDSLIDKFKHKSSEEMNTKVKKNKKHRDKSVIDISGTIDGERVDGLVKTEIKKQKREKTPCDNESQDDFVLGKLFQKKGVFGALKHDSIIQSGSQGGNLRIHTEARIRAEKSLAAIKKSRVDNWRW